ncbi:hypothetical protein [Burkholderia sp. AW49-1]
MSEIIISDLVNSKDGNETYLGFYNVTRDAEYYYGQIRLTCSTSVFYEFADLIKKHKCDTINLVGSNPDKFRFLYNKIPGKDGICNLSILDEIGSAIDSDWDLSDLSNFKNLKSLSVYSLNHLKSIDLSPLSKNLERLIFQYKGKKFNLTDFENIKALKIFDFDESDCTPISSIHSINRIAIINSKIKSLSGLNEIRSLNMLYIDKAKNLNDFSAITEMPNVEHLWFGSGVKNADWDFLSKMPQLKSLHVDKTKDLLFLKNLPNLEFFTANKTGSDDMTPLMEHRGIEKGVGRPFPFII